YGLIKLAVMAEVKTSFRPEFINRIDEIVVFHALDEAHIAGIARIQLQYLEQRLTRLDMRLEVEDAALAELVRAGFDPLFGARPLKRAIQEKLENPLAKAMLEGRFAAKDVIRVTFNGKELQFGKG
ncbi:MAG: type VI secretion system ATPase TssH, partial [Azoarcus sp.]|nr:type VI secretion system ATPase TssH [Azoarcus sp.]